MTTDNGTDHEHVDDNVDPSRGADPAEVTVTFRESLALAAKRVGIAQVEPGEIPRVSALLAAMGGVRGLVESILPGLTFVITYTVTSALLPSVLLPLVLSVVFVLLRLVTRSAVTSALAGGLGIALSAGISIMSGRAQDNFIPGFLIDAAGLIVMASSVLARWPFIGLLVGFITSDPAGWRVDRAKYRVAVIATLLWLGLFGIRLAVEVPLWVAGLTTALGTMKLILGVPLYAALLWVTWLLIRTAYARPHGE